MFGTSETLNAPCETFTVIALFAGTNDPSAAVNPVGSLIVIVPLARPPTGV